LDGLTTGGPQKQEIDHSGSISVPGGTASARLVLGRFVLRPQTPGAQVQVLHLAVDEDRGGVNIGRPVAVGVALGMADVMTVLRRFAADIALQFSCSPLVLRLGYCKFRQYIVT